MNSVKACLLNWLREQLLNVPPKPLSFQISGTRFLTVLRYTFKMPPAPPIDDLATREVSIVIDGGPSVILGNTPDKTEFTYDFDRDKNVSMTLVDIDTTGNRSVPSDPFTFVTTDTVPPEQPGIFGISKVEQV